MASQKDSEPTEKTIEKSVTLSNKSSWTHVPFLLKLITAVVMPKPPRVYVMTQRGLCPKPQECNSIALATDYVKIINN
jgi:hypothetical protein